MFTLRTSIFVSWVTCALLILKMSKLKLGSKLLWFGRRYRNLKHYSSYVTFPKEGENSVPIKAWVQGVPVEPDAAEQLKAIARLPIVHSHVVAMPDVHIGKGSCVGCVVPTIDAIIPAAVGVDIGCGMMAVRTSIFADQLPDSLKSLRTAIESAIPHGRTNHGGNNDVGAWKMDNLPERVKKSWKLLAKDYEYICSQQPSTKAKNNVNHLGTLGTGNHFIEMCLDESDRVWFMLHSGSRGPGNRIGSVYIELAKNDMLKLDKNAKIEKNLAYLKEGTPNFQNYVFAVSWAQKYARINREIMMASLIDAAKKTSNMPSFTVESMAVNCHHNYVNIETHFGKNVYLTRKGAVSAQKDELGIIPGSMGAKSYIVRGKGNSESFHSCSHGAGRVMSRAKAKKTFTIQDHVQATQGVECRKDHDVIDETPMAYKNIDDVMAAQSDLVDIVHTLKQVLCVKG